MRVDATNRRRQTALVCGVGAVLVLLGVVAAYAGSHATASRAMFGSRGSVAVVVVAAAAAIVGTAFVLTGRRTSPGARWGLALPIAVLAGGVGALAIGSLFAPHDAGDVAIGLLLAAAALGMWVVATQVAR
jgi:hypothetical protein